MITEMEFKGGMVEVSGDNAGVMLILSDHFDTSVTLSLTGREAVAVAEALLKTGGAA